jgi:acetyl esterase/lipase
MSNSRQEKQTYDREPAGPAGRPFIPGGPGGPNGPLHRDVPGVDFPITLAVPQYPDLAYASVSPTQKLDLYLPQGSGPFPVVLLFHGGGFMFGDKADPMGKAGTDLLLNRGYAVAVVNYRLSGEARAPAQIQDAKTAVRWLRAHAGEYDLNPEKFGAWGASAGGNLVALLGTSYEVPALEGAELGCAEESSQVQAVIDWFGPIDFLLMDEQFNGTPQAQIHNEPWSPESVLIGAPIQTRPDLVRVINPITYISPSASPFLIQHGSADNQVPPQQSEQLYHALVSVIGDEKVTLSLFQGARHGGGTLFWEPFNMQRIFVFLDRYLK